MNSKVGTIHPPKLNEALPKHSKWLSGQGVGAWFAMEETNESDVFRIRRFTPNGSLDCDRLFNLKKAGKYFDINKNYEFKHISHCAMCRVEQNGVVFEFNYIEA